MSAIPFMPLYVADYLADTAHLSAMENGAYLMLIMNYWQRGGDLPGKPEQLARIARVSIDEWSAMEPMLAEFFEVKDGRWHHHRIELELERVREKSVKASNAGRASAQRASNGRLTDVQRTFNGCSTNVERTFNHTDTDTDTEKKENDVVSAGAETSVDRSSKPKLRKKPAYSAEFNKFFDGFPGREGTSKAEAWEVWVTLPPEDQKAASDALSAFVAWCGKQKPDYRPLHACRYLKYRRWETLASTSTSPPVVQVPVLAGTDAFRAWERHNGRSLPTTTIRDPTTQAVIGTGWYFPTEFPQERAA